MALFRRSSPRPEAPLPYAPDSPEGLAARWVRWAASIDIDRHPVADPTGALASVSQPDDVWFLAGTFGGRAERRCAVPAGRPLFLPVFNIWRPGDTASPARLAQAVGTLMVDNESVPVEEIWTPLPFDVPVPGATQSLAGRDRCA